jgi:hypothetical protein
MLAAARNPQKLMSIERLVKKLADVDEGDRQGDSKRIIPQEFNKFWNVFKKVANIK